MQMNNAGDTVLHYAVRHTTDLELFKKLLHKVENVNQLKTLNDNGATLLHMMVAEKKYRFGKAILEYIDEKLNIANSERSVWNETDLIEMYKTKILDSKALPRPHPRKMEIINIRERKAGRTPLLAAMYENNVVICMMLLAHLADPTVADLADDLPAFISRELPVSKLIESAVYRVNVMYKTDNWADEVPEKEKSVKRRHEGPIYNITKIIKTY